MALQELCLAQITESIESYYRAYSASDNQDLQRGFQFLQRFYSHELGKRLHKKDALQEKYADLVFNRHLTSIRTKWFSTFSLEAIVQTFTRIGQNVEKVIFYEFLPTDVPWKDIICYLPNVKAMKYEYSCNNDILRYIAEYCPRLESLDITNSVAVTDDGLKYFCLVEEEDENQKDRLPCPQLKEIFLDETSVTDYSVKLLLKNIPSLEKIDYGNLAMVLYKMHKNDLGLVDKVVTYHLTYLNLYCCDGDKNINVYDEVLKVCVTVCPNLKSFECFLLKLEHLNLCSMLLDIEHLSLWRMGDSSIDVSDFLREKGGKLTSLTLRKCTVSLSAMEHSCIRLNKLTINNVIIQYNNDIIPRFDNLKQFRVQKVDLSDSGNRKSIDRILSSSPSLRKLTFEEYFISTSETKTVIWKGYEQFEFCFCYVERKFLEDILLTYSMLKEFCLICFGIPAEFEERLRRVAESLPNRPRISTY